MRKKWGIIPNKLTYIIGSHPVQRFKQRYAALSDVVTQTQSSTNNVNRTRNQVIRLAIAEQLQNGTVVLEREGKVYIRGVDNMIAPCIRMQDKILVKTVLDKQLKVFFKG